MNMQALNLPNTECNTCLIGLSDRDKASVNPLFYINNKDLRREQLLMGNPDCYSVSGVADSMWQTPHKIVMHIGDNIEDIDKVQQETANPRELLKRWGKDVFILPNSMYGSW
jgi:predicted secreted acid phosphatase